MLVELGVAEQRHRAVLEVLDGAAVTVVARRYGVTRQTVHRWLARYADEGGLANLVDRSCRPGSCPHQMPARVEVRVIRLRWEHRDWGPDRIRHQLTRARRPRGGPSVIRVADRNGAISFAGALYRAGRAWARRSIEVSLVAGSVQLSADGQVIRVHAARHDPAKEHGAFATPHGRPRKPNRANQNDHVADLQNSVCRTGTGT